MLYCTACSKEWSVLHFCNVIDSTFGTALRLLHITEWISHARPNAWNMGPQNQRKLNWLINALWQKPENRDSERLTSMTWTNENTGLQHAQPFMHCFFFFLGIQLHCAISVTVQVYLCPEAMLMLIVRTCIVCKAQAQNIPKEHPPTVGKPVAKPMKFLTRNMHPVNLIVFLFIKH